MKKFIILLILLVSIVCMINVLSEATNVTKEDILKHQVGFCESSNRHEGVWGDNGKAYGKYQFWEKTFDSLAKKAGRPELQWQSERDQEWLFTWAIQNGYGRLWTCYNTIKYKRTTAKMKVNNRYLKPYLLKKDLEGRENYVKLQKLGATSGGINSYSTYREVHSAKIFTN